MFIQKFKNKIKNRKLNFLILLIILTVVIHSIPKKIFTILNTSFIERKTSIAYDYCGKSSTGYIFDLQNRINFSNPPKSENISKRKLSKFASDGTVFLTCWMTMAQIKMMKSREVIFQNLD